MPARSFAPARALSWGDVHARRLSRSYLLEPAPRARLVDVVRDVGGIQAQVMSAAELAIGVRVRDVSEEDVRAELWERRTLVKTYGLRGTVHLLPADELGLWLAVGRAHPYWRSPAWAKSAGITVTQAEHVIIEIGAALDGRRLTRDELAKAVGRRLGSWAREVLADSRGFLLDAAAYSGHLCFGPNEGSKVTFVRPDQWLGRLEEHEPRAAVLEALRRYLVAYGPATARDFAGWINVRPADAAALIDGLASELDEVEVDGEQAWVVAPDGERTSARGRSLRLLPRYDCYVLGSRFGRDRIVPAAARAAIANRGWGRWEGAVGVALVVSGGVVTGVWQYRRKARRLDLHVELVRELSARERRQLEAEASRVAVFVGKPLELTVDRFA